MEELEAVDPTQRLVSREEWESLPVQCPQSARSRSIFGEAKIRLGDRETLREISWLLERDGRMGCHLSWSASGF